MYRGDVIMIIGFFMINKLCFSDFNAERFNEKYRIFRITSLLDYSVPDDENDNIIYSVAYETSTVFYCLVPAGSSMDVLRNIFRDYKFDLEQCSVDSVPEYILINLFVNKYPNNMLSFNNYTASLYLIYDEERKNVIPTLKFEVDSNCVLACEVSSFSKWDDITSKRFTYKQQKNFRSGKSTIYHPKGNFIIKGKEKDIYLQANINHSRNNTLNYLDLSSDYHKLAKTSQLINGLNTVDYDVMKLAFEDCGYSRVYEAKKKNVFSDIIKGLPYQETVNVVNSTDKQLDEGVFSEPGISYIFSKHIKKDCFNLNVVEVKEFYEEQDLKDRYVSIADIPVQNIEFDHICRSSLRQCYLELCMKKETIDRQTRMNSFNGKWSFMQLINGIPYRMNITDNEIMDDFSSLDVDDAFYHVFYDEDNNLVSSNPKVIEHEGNYLIIRDTNIRLMPDYEKYANVRPLLVTVDRSGKKRQTLQSKRVRDEYYGEIIDVNTFSYNGNEYYTVGNIGYGVRREFNNSVSTKQMESFGLTISDVKETLIPNVYQINRYAVYPYPFKLMKERFIQLGGNINE